MDNQIRTLNDIYFGLASRQQPELLRYKREGRWLALSSREVCRQVGRLALSLARLGIHAGDRVALLSENRPEWAIADLAVLGLGAVNVPLYPTLTAATCEYILKDSGARALIVSNAGHLEKICGGWERLGELAFAVLMDGQPPATAARWASRIHAWQSLIAGGDLTEEERRCFETAARAVQPADLASIIYTSGTTGTPKGVMLTHANIASNVASTPVETVSEGDLALSFLPLSHIYERMVDYVYLSRGVNIAYAESVEAVAQNMAEIQPTVAAAVPRFFEKMYTRVLESLRHAPWVRRKLFWWAIGVGREALSLRVKDQPMPAGLALRYGVADRLVFAKLRGRLGGRIRNFISGGGPLSPDLAEFFNAAGLVVCEGYGLTETSPVVATNVPSRIRPGTVGRPISGVEVRIAADGEILVRGPNVMKGYYNLPEETAQALRDGWLHTGDIGQLTAEGDLRITDRKKDLLKTAGGKFVAPQPIENKLRASPYILNAVVVGDRRPFIAALLVPNFDRLAEFARERGVEHASPAELVQHAEVRRLIQQQVDEVNRDLAQFEQVKRFVLLERDFTIETGELTPTLKVRRSLIEKQCREIVEGMYAGG